MLYTEENARKKFLEKINKGISGTQSELEIKTIELTEKKDFWIIYANTIPPNPQRGGMYGYLLDTCTGEVLAMDHEGPIAFLTDRYDNEIAGDKTYVLKSDFPFTSRVEVLNLKTKLETNYVHALKLVKSDRYWMAGKRRTLKNFQAMFKAKGISTTIELKRKPETLIDLEENSSIIWWDELRNVLRNTKILAEN